jgi:hypothetical protein
MYSADYSEKPSPSISAASPNIEEHRICRGLLGWYASYRKVFWYMFLRHALICLSAIAIACRRGDIFNEFLDKIFLAKNIRRSTSQDSLGCRGLMEGKGRCSKIREMAPCPHPGLNKSHQHGPALDVGHFQPDRRERRRVPNEFIDTADGFQP